MMSPDRLVLVMTAVLVTTPPTRTAEYTCRVSMATTDPKGRVTVQPPIAARTIVRGDSARADIIEGFGDFTLDSMGAQLAAALGRGVLKVKADSTAAGFERIAEGDSVAGMATERVRVTRGFRLTIQALIFKKRIATRETIDLWVGRKLGSLPNPLGGLYMAMVDAPSHANADLARRMTSINDSVGTGAPRKVVHRLVTGTGGDATSTVTTIEVSDLTTGVPNPLRFEIPPGFRRVDR